MTPKEVWELARLLMRTHGLADWTFEFDSAKRRAGSCKYKKKKITLSRYYVLRNLDKVEHIKDTILHEIAHALAGWEAGHGEQWKRVCRRIGCTGERCYDSEAVDMPVGDWQANCPGCGRLFHKHRRPKSLSGSHCRKCGSVMGQLIFRKKLHAVSV